MGEAGCDVVALEALEAVVEAESEGIFAMLPVGSKMTFYLLAISPPSEMSEDLMIPEIYLILSLSVERA